MDYLPWSLIVVFGRAHGDDGKVGGGADAMGLGSCTRYVELVVCNKNKPGRIPFNAQSNARR